MTIEQIKEHLPQYAKDMRLNFSTILSPSGAPGLTEKQIASIALACAMSTPSKELVEAMESFAQDYLNPEEIEGTKIANSLMSMTNIYYRFLHLTSNPEYKNLPARLRMNSMANPGIEKEAFELASLGVSAINGCSTCVDSHEKNLKDLGVTTQGIQSAIRIASVLYSVGVSLANQ